jgi:hypothetical protein
VTFTAVGDKSATSAVKVTGTLCGSVSPLNFSGTGTTASITVGPSPLDFGTVSCGAPAPKSQPVTVANGGTTSVTYTATLGKGGASPFKLDAPTGTIAAGSKAVINVSPNPIALPASVTANAYGDTLTVTSNAPGVAPATVTLLQSASGAIIAVNMPTTDFGLVPINTAASLPFTVVNTGNVDATVSVGTVGSLWSSSLTGNKATANGGTVPGTVGFKTPDTSASQTTLTATTTAPLCATIAPVNVTAQGEAPLANVTGAPFAVQNTCGVNNGSTATLTIANTGQTPLTLSNVNTNSPRLVLVSSVTNIPPGESGQIVVRARNPVGGTDFAAQPYNVGINFTTNEVGSPTHTILGTVTFHGANLVLSTNTINLSSAFYYQCSLGTEYDITNTGDQAGTVSVTTAAYPYGFNGISFSGAFSSAVTLQPGDVVYDGVDTRSNTCSEGDQVAFSAPTSGANHVCVAPGTLTVNVNIPLYSGSGTPFCDCFGNLGTPEQLP